MSPVYRTRWHRAGVYRWRTGLIRGEWWIGARFDFAADAWMIGVLGAVVVIGRG